MSNRSIEHTAQRFSVHDSRLNSKPDDCFHQWKSNLRVLGVTEIKTVASVPVSHPFVERLIGTIRRECLDRMLFSSSGDLDQKLSAFQDFYNAHRSHAALDGRTPVEKPREVARLNDYGWEVHCQGLYRTPIPA